MTVQVMMKINVRAVACGGGRGSKEATDPLGFPVLKSM